MNIITNNPCGGLLEILRGRGFSKAEVFKGKYEAKLNFQGVGGRKTLLWYGYLPAPPYASLLLVIISILTIRFKWSDFLDCLNLRSFIWHVMFCLQELDFEVELAFVVGKKGKKIKVQCTVNQFQVLLEITVSHQVII